MFVWGNLKTHNFKFLSFPIKNSKMLSEIITLHPPFRISNFKISEIWSLKKSLQNSKFTRVGRLENKPNRDPWNYLLMGLIKMWTELRLVSLTTQTLASAVNVGSCQKLSACYCLCTIINLTCIFHLMGKDDRQLSPLRRLSGIRRQLPLWWK